MSAPTATPSGAISDADVADMLIALRARLRETPENVLMTRPLQRRQVAILYRIVTDYQALRRRKEHQP